MGTDDSDPNSLVMKYIIIYIHYIAYLGIYKNTYIYAYSYIQYIFKIYMFIYRYVSNQLAGIGVSLWINC